MSNTGKDSSMDGEFQRRKNMLQSDRDASLKDNASMKRKGLISAAAKEARDGATMQRYDRSLEQLMSQRDSGSSASESTSLTASPFSSSSSNEVYVNIRVKEGPTEIVTRRSIGLDAASTTFIRAAELAVDDDDEWDRLRHLPLSVISEARKKQR